VAPSVVIWAGAIMNLGVLCSSKSSNLVSTRNKSVFMHQDYAKSAFNLVLIHSGILKKGNKIAAVR
jgi:hypothetical protein